MYEFEVHVVYDSQSGEAMINQSSSSIDVSTLCDPLNCSPGIGLEEEKESFSVSPNPTNSIINITTGNDIINAISIIDLSGKTVLSRKLYSAESTIDVSHISMGVYIVIAVGNNKVYKSKIIIE